MTRENPQNNKVRERLQKQKVAAQLGWEKKKPTRESDKKMLKDFRTRVNKGRAEKKRIKERIAERKELKSQERRELRKKRENNNTISSIIKG